MKLHTVFITHNRLELTKRTIESYLETVTVPHTIAVVDNASTDGTVEWLLHEFDYQIHLLGQNRYPGFSTNLGWKHAPPDATFLQRSDNDMEFLPGWCNQVGACFSDPEIGQVGLRTDEEEQHVPQNTGGNCVIRRELWDAGLRYRERPWGKYPPGYSEDSYFSPEVVRMGWRWARVKEPCIRNLASGDWSDPYYQESYGVRGITPHPDDPTVPADFKPKVR